MNKFLVINTIILSNPRNNFRSNRSNSKSWNAWINFALLLAAPLVMVYLIMDGKFDLTTQKTVF